MALYYLGVGRFRSSLVGEDEANRRAIACHTAEGSDSEWRINPILGEGSFIMALYSTGFIET